MNIKEFLQEDLSVTREKTSEVSIAIKEFLTSDKSILVLATNSYDKNKLKELEKLQDKNSCIVKLERESINISSIYSTLQELVGKDIYEQMLSNKKIRSSKINNYKKSLVLIEK